MKKRVFALALMLCLALLPMAALAASEEAAAESTETETESLEIVAEPSEDVAEPSEDVAVPLALEGGTDAVALDGDEALPDWVDNSSTDVYSVKAGKTNITLTGDVTLTGKGLVIDKDVTLDLAGYKLTVYGCSHDTYDTTLPDVRSATLQINKGCTLTLTDSSEAKTGTLFLNAGDSQWVENFMLYGTLNANGGTITADKPLRAIYLMSGGVIQCTGTSVTDFNICVTLKGGTISGGNFNAYVKTLTGGTISGGIFYGDILDSSCTIAAGSHKITFKNGDDIYATEVVASGKTTTAPKDPSKAHYIFTGWFNGENQYTFGSTLTADVTLQAGWEVAPAATVTKTPEAKTGLVYGDGEPWVTAGEAEGGTMVYIVRNTDGSSFHYFPYREELPNYLYAGTLHIYYKVAADDAHSDSEEFGPIEVTIAKRQATIVGITAKNKTYDGTTDVELEYTPYQVEIEGNYAPDYIYVVSVEGVFADANVGKGKTVEIRNPVFGGDPVWDYYDFTWAVTADIEPKEVTVSGITAEDKTYDGSTTATLNCDGATISGLLEGDTLTVSATGTFADANAGEGKTVTISGLTLGGEDASNYTLASSGQQETTTADIDKAASSATVTGKTLTYTGAEQELVSESGVVGGDVYYSVNGSSPYDSAIPTGKDVGSYVIDWYVAGDGNHESTTTERVTVTIALPANVGDAVKDMTVDNVTSDDRKTIEDTQKTVGDYLAMNPTDAEKTTLDELEAKLDGLTARLDEVKAAMEDEVITGTDGITKDNVKIADKKALKNAKAAIEKLLEDYSGNLTAEEKQTLNDKLARIGEALDEIARLEKAAKDKPVKTGDEANAALWLALAMMSAMGIAVVARKKVK